MSRGERLIINRINYQFSYDKANAIFPTANIIPSDILQKAVGLTVTLPL